jgi:3-deoxy-D-manno-octulosonate 8-phosphate phosphatase (KDO 8-P phosphatase)
MSIKLIVLDVDGTLTDGTITYSSSGDDIKSFNVKDGLGIEGWVNMGRDVAVITGRRSAVIARRANELRIKYFFEGVKNKKEVLLNLMNELSLSQEEVACIGDDLNDMSMLSVSGLTFAPNDACYFIKDNIDIVLSTKGGHGAVREMIEYIIKHEDVEEQFLKTWQFE